MLALVGSHNLTARATEGANLEAAILLAGHSSEAPFQAARQHIEACRQESSPCPVEPSPLPDGENVDVVIVHAETDELPNGPSLWHVRLGLRSAEYDWLLRPVADVRLHLYKRGDLARGWRYAVPWASYAGTLTGVNFTDVHPDTPGIPAVWSDDHYSITEQPSALQFSKAPPGTDRIVTQAVINIQSLAPPNEAFLPAKPKAARDEETERRLLGWTDEDISTFFTRPSIQDGHLVYEIRHQGKASWSLSISDLRESDRLKLNEDAERRRIGLLDVLEEKRARHPLIMRAKYKLRGTDLPRTPF